MDRRGSSRIHEPFPVRINGTDLHGKKFLVETVLDNLSAGGLYVRIPQPVSIGRKVFMVVRVSADKDSSVPAPTVAANGVVKRVDRQPDGKCGLGIAFTRHRFV